VVDELWRDGDRLRRTERGAHPGHVCARLLQALLLRGLEVRLERPQCFVDGQLLGCRWHERFLTAAHPGDLVELGTL
jgi:hypothetical protein